MLKMATFRAQFIKNRQIADTLPLKEARFVPNPKAAGRHSGVFIGKTLLGSFQNGMDSSRPTRPMVCHPALKWYPGWNSLEFASIPGGVVRALPREQRQFAMKRSLTMHCLC